MHAIVANSFGNGLPPSENSLCILTTTTRGNASYAGANPGGESVSFSAGPCIQHRRWIGERHRSSRTRKFWGWRHKK